MFDLRSNVWPDPSDRGNDWDGGRLAGYPSDGNFAFEGVRKWPAVIQITLGVCVASLGARWVLEAWFDPARAISSLLAAAVVVTEFLWSNSTVQISKDISPLHGASFCVIYLFTNGWFILTRWEENC